LHVLHQVRRGDAEDRIYVTGDDVRARGRLVWPEWADEFKQEGCTCNGTAISQAWQRAVKAGYVERLVIEPEVGPEGAYAPVMVRSAQPESNGNELKVYRSRINRDEAERKRIQALLDA
jgi:hypothetical protein